MYNSNKEIEPIENLKKLVSFSFSKRTNLSIVGWRAEKSKANVPINNFLLKKQFKQSWQVLPVKKNFLHFPLFASLLTAC